MLPHNESSYLHPHTKQSLNIHCTSSSRKEQTREFREYREGRRTQTQPTRETEVHWLVDAPSQRVGESGGGSWGRYQGDPLLIV